MAGWLVFAISFIVFALSAEPTGSLWDCGEFISGAYKLQVVHPPGAPLFIMVGRIFTWVATLVSDDPANIAYAVNLMSGLCSALAAMFICWTTILLTRLAILGRDTQPEGGQAVAITASGIVAGLSTAFLVSLWFSAVEGEVYAMSTFFTAMTLWAAIKWYSLPDEPDNDRWMMFAVYSSALSIGVHLLSLLIFPALAIFYYYKKYNNHTLKGYAIAAAIGVGFIIGIQMLIIAGIPKVWAGIELFMVNTLGMKPLSGLIPTIILLLVTIYLALRYTEKHQNGILQSIVVAFSLSVLAFSTIGVVIIRAQANPPINMNDPSDPFRLVSYLNREQYGERPLMRGPHFDARPIDTEISERYGLINGRYEKIERKIEYVYNNTDKILFPRIGHYEGNKPEMHRLWMGGRQGTPTMADNLSFFFRYQLGWMYFRYFMWNFAGRQNGEQGYFSWDPTKGNWISGITPIDSWRLYDQSGIPAQMRNDQSRNKYYFIPLILGLLGLGWHYARKRKDFIGVLALFVITGIGIIVYSNQPPNEPRERDYVLVGSFMTFCIWVGMGVMALYDIFQEKLRLGAVPAASLGALLALAAPALMLQQGYDDMSRRHHFGSRDYAANYLNSCEKNAILFTYGDNDTYPLWYVQEVEGIRRDVRVVNLSLIAVDWYIDQLRRKVNDSPAIKLTIPSDAYRGFRRNQVPVYPPETRTPMDLLQALKIIGEDHPKQTTSGVTFESYVPTTVFTIPVNRQKASELGAIGAGDTAGIAPVMTIDVGNQTSLIKDELAILDVIASNIWDRPIYFAVTVQKEKLLGFEKYFRLEGLAQRITPVMSQGDRKYGPFGFGGIDPDILYNNVMTKWRWGNFDKMRLFVDQSYSPTVLCQRMSMLRTAEEFVTRGQKEKAIDIIDQFFKSFPHMNFPYDSQTLHFLRLYIAAGAYEKAKPQMKILADQTEDYLRFFTTLDEATLEGAFSEDKSMYNFCKDELLKMAKDNQDSAFEGELIKRFQPYDKTSPAPQPAPGNENTQPAN